MTPETLEAAKQLHREIQEQRSEIERLGNQLERIKAAQNNHQPIIVFGRAGETEIKIHMQHGYGIHLLESYLAALNADLEAKEEEFSQL